MKQKQKEQEQEKKNPENITNQNKNKQNMLSDYWWEIIYFMRVSMNGR